MLNNYKWYRKLRGGVWYKNRYLYNFGATIIFRWERTKGGNNGGYDAYLIVKEDYRNDHQKQMDRVDSLIKEARETMGVISIIRNEVG